MVRFFLQSFGKCNNTETTFENFHQNIKPYLNFEGEYKLSRRFTLYKSDVSYGWVSFRYKIPRRKDIKIDFKKSSRYILLMNQ